MIGTVEAAVEQMRNMRATCLAAMRDVAAEAELAGLAAVAGRVRRYIDVLEHHAVVRRYRRENSRQRSDRGRHHQRRSAA